MCAAKIVDLEGWQLFWLPATSSVSGVVAVAVAVMRRSVSAALIIFASLRLALCLPLSRCIGCGTLFGLFFSLLPHNLR